MSKKFKKINVITLGCSKNLVDSEVLLKQLKANNLIVEHNSNNTGFDTVIINTCGFIDDAKQESIDLILDYANAKKQGLINNLFVMGCLSERYKDELKNEIPEVDEYFGSNNLKDIINTFEIDYKKELIGERLLTTPKHYAYLKISEGCDRTCSYCAIPLMRGKYKSKTIETVIAEAEFLVKQGVKELILIAQDLSYYGLDIYKEHKLAELITKLSDIKGVEWIRIHYTYPTNFPYDILNVMSEKDNVCNYLDIAFQHISDNMLNLMRRNITKQETYDLIMRIRETVPNIAIRTTLLVGHPGETEQDFEELKQFVKDVKFDRLGVFTYSHEEDTYAYNNYEDDITEAVKQERADKIMEIQQQISQELNSNKIGKYFNVIIDREEGDYFVGRTEFDSPEVDDEVLVLKENFEIKIGEFYKVEIISSDDYDLYAKFIT
ncbi:MAG: 30S ribosomal protein S12 methylthiotransferase RimO [Bacteroidetes bacterium]|nr:MAG: 30S ribosomal protein S12 methylthiotransferase RimO [Bacteroidota bacterium]